MNFEELANMRLDAGWQAIQSAAALIFREPTQFETLLNQQYAHLSALERKLYFYSPQLVIRFRRSGLVESSLLFEPPRIPDHRQGLEHGLRELITWLVERGRMTEAQRWANFSRVVLECSEGIEYLDRGAQASIFCIGESSSRFYLNLQILSKSARARLLDALGGTALYEQVEKLTDTPEVHLGGMGLEVSGATMRLKLYIRGHLGALRALCQRCTGVADIEAFREVDSANFVRDSIQAEVALERGEGNSLLAKWVMFVDDPSKGYATCNEWLSSIGHGAVTSQLLETFGGPSAIFGFGGSISQRNGPLERVNVYLRPAR